MSSFKFLSFKEITTNFNELAKKELQKYGALEDFSKLEKANKERADQLSLIDDTFAQLNIAYGISEEEKVKIIMGVMLKVKNDIRKTYPKYTPEFLIFTDLYHGTNPAMGVTSANLLTEAGINAVSEAYEQHLRAVESEERFAAYRDSESYKNFKDHINSLISYHRNESDKPVSEDCLIPSYLDPVESLVQNEPHYFADNMGFKAHFKDDKKALERYQTYEDSKNSYDTFVKSVQPEVVNFKSSNLKSVPAEPKNQTEDEKVSHARYNSFMHFNKNLLSQVGTFKKSQLRKSDDEEALKGKVRVNLN